MRTPVGPALVAHLRRLNVALVKENRRLHERLNDITDDVVLFTADRAVRKGETVMVRVPKYFVVKNV
jgi:CRISPR/Cas system type I-B associated protein Csh2 (Cas7 group RAMP superfamily)